MTYDICSTFMGKLGNVLGRSFEEFSTLDNFTRTSLLRCENWYSYDFEAF